MLPERFVAESLVEALAEVPVARALVARAREAREVLPDALRARGAEVDVLELYETVAEPLAPGALAAARERRLHHVHLLLDGALLPAGRAADRGGGPPLSESTRIVSIGPVTSETLREHGLSPTSRPSATTWTGVIDALLADAASRSRGADS